MATNLPAQYADLYRERGPKMLVQGISTHGTFETPGKGDNPAILAWAKEVGLDGIYKHDETAWCGLWMAVIAKRAGKELPKDPLWARNWGGFGVKTDEAMLGDVLVFEREGGGGHVALYVGEDADFLHCLGGNQKDQVCIIRIEKKRLLAACRPIYSIAQPPNVRPIIRKATGAVSANEA